MKKKLTPRRALFILCLAVALNPAVASSQTNPLQTTHVCRAITLPDQALFNAVMLGDLRLVKQLLQRGVSPNAKDDCNISAVTAAVNAGHPDVLEELIAAGADVNQIDNLDNKPPLLWAFDLISEDNKEAIPRLVKLLLKAGAHVNARDDEGKTALILAVAAELEEVAADLVAGGADVNVPDDDGLTAYSYAALRGNRKLMSLLISAGANLRVGVKGYEERFGADAIIFAATDGRTDVVEALLASGTDVNTANPAGVTALMRVIDDSSLDALLAAGADVNRRDHAGFTALHWAAVTGNDVCVRKLIAAGAEVNAVNKAGETPLDLAKWEAQTILIEAGAKHGAKKSI